MLRAGVADPASAAERRAQPGHQEFGKSDASPDACRGAEHRGQPVHRDAWVRDRAWERRSRDARVPGRSADLESEKAAGAWAHQAWEKAEEQRTQDSADGAGKAGLRDPDEEEQPGAERAVPQARAARKALAVGRRAPLRDEVRWVLRDELRHRARAAESAVILLPVFRELRSGAMTKMMAAQRDGWAEAARAGR